MQINAVELSGEVLIKYSSFLAASTRLLFESLGEGVFSGSANNVTSSVIFDKAISLTGPNSVLLYKPQIS